MDKRTFDLIIFGATGFTGKLVVEYLRNSYKGKPLKWAISGRNEEKLISLKKELGCEEIAHIVADSSDLESLKKMAGKTKVVTSVVGPYARYGSKLIEACIKAGTDYCDITGEVHWMRKMIDQWQEKAKEKGVRIVHCCGFDSIPSDMGVMWFQEMAKQKTGRFFKHISMQLVSFKGGISGGTYASMFNIREEAEKDRSIYKVIMRPYSLNPNPEFKGPDKRDLKEIKKDPLSGGYIAPFIMATINTRVVRRSHALLDFPYGKEFTYDESLYCGKGLRGKWSAIRSVLPLLAIRYAKPGSVLNKLIRKFLPKPGQGPSRETIENGNYKLQLLGLEENGKLHKATIKGKWDPGYGATSRMLAESAIYLAGANSNPEQMRGFLTPSTALGPEFIDQLQKNAGMVFVYESTTADQST